MDSIRIRWRLHATMTACFFGAIVLLMVVAPVRASTWMHDPKVYGFTADGKSFVYVVRQEPSDSEDLWNRAVIMDVRTASEIKIYDFLYGENPQQTMKDFRAWLAKNPTRCQGGPRSPDGQATMQITYKGGDRGRHGMAGSWKKATFNFAATGVKEDGSDMYVGSWIDMRGVLQTAAGEAPLFRWRREGTWGLSGTMFPCWSPDDRRIAMVFFRMGSGSRDPGSIEAFIRPIQGPRIQVVLPKASSPPISEVANRLETAGFILSEWRKTRERQPRRLKIQSAAGRESAAQQLATHFFDSATFEKLPAADNFDIVVNLGPAIPPLRP